MSAPPAPENEHLLELFFSQSLDGIFLMMLDEPVEWADQVDKDQVLEYVFTHQRMTKVNPAMIAQLRAHSAEELLGRTPADFFAHDPEAGKRVWREFFDHGRLHTETDERRLDGSPIHVEGDYLCIYDGQGRIAGHFGIQRDVTDRHLADERLRASRQELRALAARLERVREEERTRIAREIHDVLGQALTGLKLDIAWIKPRLPPGSEVTSECASIIQRIDGTLDAVRRIATELRPSVLDQLGLAAAIEWLGSDFRRRTGIQVDLDLAAEADGIPGEISSAAFRILQEALTNVARHAGARRVTIQLRRSPPLLELTVTDDGCGMQAERLESGLSLGLVGMRERALACGAEFTVAATPGRGTTVSLRIPVAAPETP